MGSKLAPWSLARAPLAHSVLSERLAQNSTHNRGPGSMSAPEPLEKRPKSDGAVEEGAEVPHTANAADVGAQANSADAAVERGKVATVSNGGSEASSAMECQEEEGDGNNDGDEDTGFSYEDDNNRLKMVDTSIAGSATGARFWTSDGQVAHVGTVIVAAAIGSNKGKLVCQGQLLPSYVKGGDEGDVVIGVLQHNSNHQTSVVVWNPKQPQSYRQVALKGLSTLVAASKDSKTVVFHHFDTQLAAEMVMNRGMEFVKAHFEAPARAVPPMPSPANAAKVALPTPSSAVETLGSYTIDGTDMFQLMSQKEQLAALSETTKGLAAQVKHLVTGMAKLEEQVRVHLCSCV